jgi:ricin-type beta-trefoil lectin protein
MKNIRVSALVSRRTFFTGFTLLVVILASDSLGGIFAQGSKDRTGSRDGAIDRAQQAVRERITGREGGHDPTVLFNSDAQTQFKSNREVRVRGTGTFSRTNDWRNNNPRNDNSRNRDRWSRNFSYEAVANNHNRNVFGVNYNWRGGWSGGGNGGDGYGGRPSGRVSYSGSIMNRGSNKGLDVAGRSTQEGANIQQWEYGNQPNQNWDVIDLSNGEVAIISGHSGKALTVEGGRDNNGANIIQRSWSNNAQQRWRLEQVGDNYYRIVSVDNGKCLDVAGQGKQNGANVQLWNYVSQTNQQWRLR